MMLWSMAPKLLNSRVYEVLHYFFQRTLAKILASCDLLDSKANGLRFVDCLKYETLTTD